MKTKKLELKHLAPYLPYGLKLYTGQIENCELLGIDIAGGIIQGPYCSDNYEGEPINGKFFNSGSVVKIDSMFKPILRPLSDLLPYENGEIDGMGETNDMVLIRIVKSTDTHCDAYDEWQDSFMDNPIQDRILQAPYEVFEKMLEQHYDVFGLIDAGLAIDINTLEQHP